MLAWRSNRSFPVECACRLCLPASFHQRSSVAPLCCSPPGALQIEQSEESDQGKYECVATNNDGTRYSAPANLYVRGRKPAPAAFARLSNKPQTPIPPCQLVSMLLPRLHRTPPAICVPDPSR